MEAIPCYSDAIMVCASGKQPIKSIAVINVMHMHGLDITILGKTYSKTGFFMAIGVTIILEEGRHSMQY